MIASWAVRLAPYSEVAQHIAKSGSLASFPITQLRRNCSVQREGYRCPIRNRLWTEWVQYRHAGHGRNRWTIVRPRALDTSAPKLKSGASRSDPSKVASDLIRGDTLRATFLRHPSVPI